MAERLTPSPLPGRVPAPRPAAHWLWQAPGMYDGILVPDPADAPRVLPPHLDAARQVLATEAGVVLLFRDPVALVPAALGPALALRATVAGGFCAFDCAAAGVPVPADCLVLLQQGLVRIADLSTATAVEPLDFWQVPDLSVARAHPVPQAPSSQGADGRIRRRKPDPRLVELTGDANVLADVRDSLGVARDRRLPMDAARWASGSARVAWRLFMVALAVVVVLAVGSAVIERLSTMSTDGLIHVLGPLLIFVLVVVVIGMMPGRAARGGRVPRVPGRAPARPVPSRPRGPGLLSRLKGWMLWNTPLGDDLRRQAARQVEEVQAMIRRGEIDRALKRALAVGEREAEKAGRRAHAPNLPRPRATLDLDFGPADRLSMPLLGQGTLRSLQGTYRALAQDRSRSGDHRRAAFIYAELLGDVPAALAELEAAGAYLDAARLATARRSAGHVAARLWYLAGEKDVALALARRHDAMAFIANMTAPADPDFSAFVRGHWVRDLIAAGELARAVREAHGHRDLDALRRSALERAVQEGLLDDPDILVPAVVTLDWPLEALDETPPPPGAGAAARLGVRLHAVVNGNEAADAEARALLVRGLGAQRAAAFREVRGPALADALIRAVLIHDSGVPLAPTLSELKDLAAEMDLTVLAEDLRQIVRNRQKRPPGTCSVPLPAAPEGPNRWPMLCCTPGGSALLGGADGEVTLCLPGGRRAWTDAFDGLVGLVPVGTGRSVLLVQRHHPRDLRVGLLDIRTGSVRPLGILPLIEWAETASASAWLVRTADGIGALNLPALLAPEPALEMLWSIRQTVPLRVLSFVDGRTEARWLTQRDEHGDPGLIELWTLEKGHQRLSVQIVEPAERGPCLYTTPQVWLTGNRLTPLDQKLTKGGSPAIQYLGGREYSYDQENSLRRTHAGKLAELQGFARVTAACHCAVALQEAASDACDLSFWRGRDRTLALLRGGAIAAQAALPDGRHLAVVDTAGRLHLCDTARARIETVQV